MPAYMVVFVSICIVFGSITVAAAMGFARESAALRRLSA